jgi:hypothetical protein
MKKHHLVVGFAPTVIRAVKRTRPSFVKRINRLLWQHKAVIIEWAPYALIAGLITFLMIWTWRWEFF